MSKHQIKTTPCKACGAPIHFVESRKGRLIPCNDRKISIVTVMGDVVSGWESHFSNCPGAETFRKKNRVDGKE